MKLLWIILGMVCALAYSVFVYSEGTGYPPKLQITFYPILYKGMIILSMTPSEAIHVHHWVLSLIVLSVIVYYRLSYFWMGFFLVMFAHGVFAFRDSLEFVVPNPYFERARVVDPNNIVIRIT